MIPENSLAEALRTHPCYNEDAHHEFARMHLPVAPRCNIQCNYCNRKYDCCNESRPGVTSEILTPEQAVDKIRVVMEKIPSLKVIGIAGPGDPLANESTFETLRLVKKEFPDLTLCISTNGLMLHGNEKRLFDLGVRFVTVTINAFDPDIAAKIYDHIIWKGKTYNGTEGAKILIDRQLQGMKGCADLGILVKANIVMVPGVNDEHIPDLVKTVKKNGAYIVNILPLIPIEGTKFADKRAPTGEERRKLMDLCSIDAKMMRHCKQCRADAIGLLNNDRSGEFTHVGSCRSCCDPKRNIPELIIPDPCMNRVAIATTSGDTVDSGFGNAKRFDIYEKVTSGFELIKTVRLDSGFEVSGKSHKEHIESIIRAIDNCGIIAVKEIGPMPENILQSNKIRVIRSDGENVEELLNRVLSQSI